MIKNREYKEKRIWNKHADIYDSFIKKTVASTYDEILKQLPNDLHEDYSMLELGAGTGILTFSASKKVKSIIATDISEEMIRVAEQKRKKQDAKNIIFDVQDAYKLSFNENSFDAVLVSNVLHLLYEPQTPLNEIKRVLKPNGILIAPTFCVGENLKSRFTTWIAGVFTSFKIVNKWSIKGFTQQLTSLGFSIQRMERIDGRFPLAYVVAEI